MKKNKIGITSSTKFTVIFCGCTVLFAVILFAFLTFFPIKMENPANGINEKLIASAETTTATTTTASYVSTTESFINTRQTTDRNRVTTAANTEVVTGAASNTVAYTRKNTYTPIVTTKAHTVATQPPVITTEAPVVTEEPVNTPAPIVTDPPAPATEVPAE